MNVTYVNQDERGVYRVAGTRVQLDSLVVSFLQGLSAEAMQSQFPSLTLEQVYGALAFYLGRQDEIDNYLKSQEQVWTEARRRIDERPAAVVQRLRTLRRSRVASEP